MSFFYLIIIYPLELLIEFIYVVFMKAFSNSGMAIIGISVAINMLTLPLYAVADKLQREERDTRVRLQSGIRRIKDAFKGDEQYMILSTFYKQNHYHPAYALRSSVSLLIQVPFFIAAYNFLLHLQDLQGLGFLFIKDLGKPDGLLSIGGIPIHLLPILMTLINIVAGAIYSKGFPLRDKIQIYGMAAFFLVLLYQSPAGLVFYWTMNNVFSLGKNIFYRFKHPLKVLYICMSGAVVAASAVIIAINPNIAMTKIGILVFASLSVISLPLLLKLGNWVYSFSLASLETDSKASWQLLVLASLVLWLLCGLVIPANLISSSPLEFANTGTVSNPISYIAQTMVVFFGIWMFLPLSISRLFPRKVQTIIASVLVAISLVALLNTFVFIGDYGTLTAMLQFQDSSMLVPPVLMNLLSLLAAFLCFIGVAFLIRFGKSHWVKTFLIVMLLSLVAGGGYSMVSIKGRVQEYQAHIANQGQENRLGPTFNLSRDAKNVIVLFLDRAINSYFPLVIDQFPELKTQFAGFSYYPNTVSFGGHTVVGAPPIMGGYEYTPDAINERTGEKLVDKHNEAMLVLPRMFLEAGYSVTVTDPPFSNYKWAGDLTPFAPYPQIDVSSRKGTYTVKYKKEHSQDFNGLEVSTVIKKYLPAFVLTKIALPILRPVLYDDGHYVTVGYSGMGVDQFLDSYAQLYYLNQLTSYDAKGNTYTFMANDTTHDPVLLQSPSYTPRSVVTSSESPLSNLGLSEYEIASYEINAAALIQLGKWFDTLRSEGVYDNTRIIIVADHGFALYSPVFSQFAVPGNYANYHPLLLVKDFNATGAVVTNNTFSTIADAPLFALKDLGIGTVNPFTGKDIFTAVKKDSVNIYETDFEPSAGTTFAFDYSKSYSVKDDIRRQENWTGLAR